MYLSLTNSHATSTSGQKARVTWPDNRIAREGVQQTELDGYKSRGTQTVEGNYRVHFVTRRKHGGVSVSAQFDLT